MAANVDSIIKMMVEKKRMFFALMDRQKEAGHQPNEFSIRTYKRALQMAAEQETDNADKGAVYNTLSHENLIDFGLAYDLNGLAGTFLVKSWVVEMLRELDHKRMVSLPEATFETMRTTLMTLASRVTDPSLDWSDSQDSAENIDNISRVTGEVLDKLNSNVQALEGHADKLGEVAKSEQFYEMDHGARQLRALQEIERIYLRNVIPTLSFLNPNADMQTAVDSLNRISEALKANGRSKEYTATRRVIFAFKAIGVRVKKIEVGLKGYLPMLQSQRELYDAIEKRFNRLHQLVVERMNGREYGATVNAANSRLPDYESLAGLKVYRNAILGKPFNMMLGEGRLYIDSYLLAKVDENAMDRLDEPPSYIAPPPIDDQSRAHREILVNLMALMRKFVLPESNDDMIKALHNYLDSDLPGYTLPYVFEALPLLPVAEGRRLTYSTGITKAMIIQGEYCLRYYPRFYKTSEGA